MSSGHRIAEKPGRKLPKNPFQFPKRGGTATMVEAIRRNVKAPGVTTSALYMTMIPEGKQEPVGMEYGSKKSPTYVGYRIQWGKVRAVCDNLARGLSLTSACARAKVRPTMLSNWQERYPIVQEQIAQAQLERLAYLEEGLLKEDAKMPQIVSRIFALKNADPSVWSDNPGQSQQSLGLSQNITVVTGVPEAPAKVTIENHPTENQPTQQLPTQAPLQIDVMSSPLPDKERE